jgi:hypothetical protein
MHHHSAPCTPNTRTQSQNPSTHLSPASSPADPLVTDTMVCPCLPSPIVMPSPSDPDPLACRRTYRGACACVWCVREPSTSRDRGTSTTRSWDTFRSMPRKKGAHLAVGGGEQARAVHKPTKFTHLVKGTGPLGPTVRSAARHDRCMQCMKAIFSN